MKKVFLFLVSAVLIVAGSVFLQSCAKENGFRPISETSNPLELDTFEFFGEMVKLNRGELKWREQLSLFKERINPRIEHNGLTLMGYRHIDRIGSSIAELEKVKTRMLQNPVSLVYHSPDNFEVSKTLPFSYEEFMSMLSELSLMDTKSSTSDTNIIQYFFGDMSIVELQWTYKGNRLNTYALVSSKRGIVYDHILKSIFFVEILPASESLIPRLRAAGVENPNTYIRPFGSIGGVSLSGSCQICVGIQIAISRQNQQISIDGFQALLHPTGSGHGCHGRVQSISHSMGTDGYVHVAWGVSFQRQERAVSFTLKGTGGGFSISGATSSRTGDAMISAAEISNSINSSTSSPE